jgi:hypothetical protein
VALPGRRGVLKRVAIVAAASIALGVVRLSPQPADEAVTFVGAGDIAECGNLEPARATARLLDGIAGEIFTLGDHAYDHGNAREFRDCYGPTWGRHKARTRPTIGNHDVLSNGGSPYFAYFGDNAGPGRRGYYSYELGVWHIVALNSEASMAPGSPQIAWLRDDLAAHPGECALAYWHIPRFASQRKGDVRLAEAWRVLYAAGVDVVLNGHEHAYERFAPQDPLGHLDRARGVREFIVGTGGGKLNTIKKPAPNVEVYADRTFGVLKLTLRPHAYAWEFVPAMGRSFTDRGEAGCSPTSK